MQKITPFLWFNQNAEEAVELYTSLFDNSRILDVKRYGEAGPGPAGSVMSLTFQLEGQEFIAINGGPQFSFSPAISLFVNCLDQDEVDRLWDRLCEGGEEQPCGWLKDKFGVSWQIIPAVLGELLWSSDAAKSQRTMQAMFGMKKLDVAALQRA